MTGHKPSPTVRTLPRLFVFPLLFIATGCAHDPGAQVSDQGSLATASRTAEVSAKERLDRAVDLLQQGKVDDAKATLEAYLQDVPDSKPAKLLMREIETPLPDLYPKQNFSVTLGRNDTLSGIAATYLGDPLAFYGLARYNNISIPGKILAAQQIRIPATSAALAVQNRQHGDVILAVSESSPGTTAAVPELRLGEPAPPANAEDPWNGFESAVSHHQYPEAAKLADAANFKPGKGRAAILADTYMRASAIEQKSDAASAEAHARKAGKIYLSFLKQPDKARECLKLALSLVPSDTEADAALKQTNDQLAGMYYRRGLVAFQHQDLDGAIAAWDRALAINPNYRDAQLNRAQAVQLKANLQKLKG